MKPPVLLIGNQNAGKSSLFNALTGLNSRVANYPGVTTEARVGEIRRFGGDNVYLIDLPGTYSLIPASDEEELTVKALFGELKPMRQHSLVVVVIDCSELRRGLYLYSQIIELGFKAIIALTMVDQRSDAWQQHALSILKKEVGCIVVPVSINDKKSIKRLTTTIDGILAGSLIPLVKEQPLLAQTLSLPLVEKLGHSCPSLKLAPNAHNSADLVRNNNIFLYGLSKRGRLGKNKRDLAHLDLSPEDSQELDRLFTEIPEMRFLRVDTWLRDLKSDIDPQRAKSDTMDKILLQPFIGTVFLLLLFIGMLQSLFLVAEPLSELMGQAINHAGTFIGNYLPHNSMIHSLIVDGVFEGIGSILSFLPLIGLLFFFLSLLEDSGYLARATYLLDSALKRVGLCGRSLMPMLSGFACAVPAIMAARTIGNRKERLITILTTPFLTCSARLPVFGLIVGAIFSNYPPVFGIINVGALMFVAMYVLSVITALLASLVLKKILKADGVQTLAIELPPYRWPNPISTIKRVYDRLYLFIRDVGSVILASTIVIWALFHFEPYQKTPSSQEHLELVSHKDLSNTYAGVIGKSIEPMLLPLGLDWQIGVGIFSSFLAREVFVSTMAVVYGMSKVDEEDTALRTAFKKHVSPLSGLCLLIFFTLSMQCISTLATTRRETGSFVWPLVQFVMMTGTGYVLSLITYSIGSLLGYV